jgi:hypothetical protein
MQKEITAALRVMHAAESALEYKLRQLKVAIAAAERVNGVVEAQGQPVLRRKGPKRRPANGQLQKALRDEIARRGGKPVPKSVLIKAIQKRHPAVAKRAGRYLSQVVSMCLRNAGEFRRAAGDAWR